MSHAMSTVVIACVACDEYGSDCMCCMREKDAAMLPVAKKLPQWNPSLTSGYPPAGTVIARLNTSQRLQAASKFK